MYCDMKTFGGVDAYTRVFLTSVLDGGGWSASVHGRSTFEEITFGSHWIQGWVNPRTGLDDEKNLVITGARTPTIRPSNKTKNKLRGL
jgi:hypothetical protein